MHSFPDLAVAIGLFAVGLLLGWLVGLAILGRGRTAGAAALAAAGARAEAAEARAERAEAAVRALEARLERAREESNAIARTASALGETVEQERRAAAEKLALMRDARAAMTADFRVMAEEIMTRHGESFGRQNREQIDGVLAPLRERIAEFAQGLATAQGESTKERAELAERIRALSETSARMSAETTDLTRALRGRAEIRGAWGEMVLASILERSGLREGEEYEVQSSHATEEGRRLRPDVVVKLPGGRNLVIDSKVSLVDFETSINAPEAAEREAAARRHLAAMRGHIRDLSSKSYHASLPGSLDHVVMFVPIEGALASALTVDPDLTRHAIESDVAIATPTTLMIALRTTASVWQIERRNLNAETIAERAGRIYEKFVGFVDDMTRIGREIEKAAGAHRDAMGKLSTGSGNLVRQVETLRSLGARTGKRLPASLLGDEEPSPRPPE